jgi:hypothetical protein
MQRYTIFFIAVDAQHVSGGLSANSPTLAVAASKLDIYQMLCVQFELLMMGGKNHLKHEHRQQ